MILTGEGFSDQSYSRWITSNMRLKATLYSALVSPFYLVRSCSSPANVSHLVIYLFSINQGLFFSSSLGDRTEFLQRQSLEDNAAWPQHRNYN